MWAGAWVGREDFHVKGIKRSIDEQGVDLGDPKPPRRVAFVSPRIDRIRPVML